jgi:hypothetical protein
MPLTGAIPGSSSTSVGRPTPTASPSSARGSAATALERTAKLRIESGAARAASNGVVARQIDDPGARDAYVRRATRGDEDALTAPLRAVVAARGRVGACLQRQPDYDAPLIQQEDIWWSDLQDLWYSIFKRKWSCNASCNIEGTEPHCTGRVTGSATGTSEEEACREAKRDATQKAPRGCYARHCQCDCSQG